MTEQIEHEMNVLSNNVYNLEKEIRELKYDLKDARLAIGILQDIVKPIMDENERLKNQVACLSKPLKTVESTIDRAKRHLKEQQEARAAREIEKREMAERALERVANGAKNGMVITER